MLLHSADIYLNFDLDLVFTQNLTFINMYKF